MPVNLWPTASTALVDQLHRRLKPKRFHHVLGVLHTALGLADCHGISAEKVTWVALLHDAWKTRSPEDERRRAEELGETIPEEDQAHPGMWHAWAAAGEARRGYGIEDPEILDALRYHSTGWPGMGAVGKIIVCADYLEPTRGRNGTGKILELARRDLDAGCALVLRAKCNHMLGQNMKIHRRALAALEQLPAPPQEV